MRRGVLRCRHSNGSPLASPGSGRQGPAHCRDTRNISNLSYLQLIEVSVRLHFPSSSAYRFNAIRMARTYAAQRLVEQLSIRSPNYKWLTEGHHPLLTRSASHVDDDSTRSAYLIVGDAHGQIWQEMVGERFAQRSTTKRTYGSDTLCTNGRSNSVSHGILNGHPYRADYVQGSHFPTWVLKGRSEQTVPLDAPRHGD